MAIESKISFSEELAVVRGEQYREIYINHARAGATSWDVHVTLGALTERAPGVPVVEEQVTFRMTPEFAKALVATIQSGIDVRGSNPKLALPVLPAVAAKKASKK